MGGRGTGKYLKSVFIDMLLGTRQILFYTGCDLNFVLKTIQRKLKD